MHTYHALWQSRSAGSSSRDLDGAVCMQMVHSPLGEALATFAGEPGGPQVPAWQPRPPMPPQSEQAPRVMHAPPPLPQPLSAGAALAITQLQLLGRVFGVLDEASQLHVLESVTAALAAEAPPGVLHGCRLLTRRPVTHGHHSHAHT